MDQSKNLVGIRIFKFSLTTASDGHKINRRFALEVYIFVRFSPKFWQFYQNSMIKQLFNAVCVLLREHKH